jgi:hypothetical protein
MHLRNRLFATGIHKNRVPDTLAWTAPLVSCPIYLVVDGEELLFDCGLPATGVVPSYRCQLDPVRCDRQLDSLFTQWTEELCAEIRVTACVLRSGYLSRACSNVGDVRPPHVADRLVRR